MSKFKGEVVFYMKGNLIKKAAITGVTSHEGKVWTGSELAEIPEGTTRTMLTFGNYDVVNINDVFQDVESLISHLQSHIVEDK